MIHHGDDFTVTCKSYYLVMVQRFAGWLSQILRREFAHARNFNSKSPPKVSACADFRRKFVTTNLQTSVDSFHMDNAELDTLPHTTCSWKYLVGAVETEVLLALSK